MKANEAPEKIYIYEASVPELTEKLPYHLEYIRKDAFIEKATDWLEGHIYEYLKMNRTWNEPDYDPKLIGDFIGYMKGE